MEDTTQAKLHEGYREVREIADRITDDVWPKVKDEAITTPNSQPVREFEQLWQDLTGKLRSFERELTPA